MTCGDEQVLYCVFEPVPWNKIKLLFKWKSVLHASPFHVYALNYKMPRGLLTNFHVCPLSPELKTEKDMNYGFESLRICISLSCLRTRQNEIFKLIWIRTTTIQCAGSMFRVYILWHLTQLENLPPPLSSSSSFSSLPMELYHLNCGLGTPETLQLIKALFPSLTMIWSVLAMITGTEPKTTAVPFKVLLVTLLAVARVDTRIKKGTEGKKHTGRWLFNRSIFLWLLCKATEMICQWDLLVDTTLFRAGHGTHLS